MATRSNLLGYFGKAIARKRKPQPDITSFFKKAEHALFFNFYCIGTLSSPLSNKRPVGRPKKEFSCEQLNCILEQNHDFNALLTSCEKCNKTIANF